MADINGGDNAHAVAVGQLRSFVERIERLKEEQATLAEDIKAVKAEAKSAGFDNKALSVALSLRAKDETTLAHIKVYSDALGIFG